MLTNGWYQDVLWTPLKNRTSEFNQLAILDTKFQPTEQGPAKGP